MSPFRFPMFVPAVAYFEPYQSLVVEIKGTGWFGTSYRVIYNVPLLYGNCKQEISAR